VADLCEIRATAEAATQAGPAREALGLLANACGISPALGAALHPRRSAARPFEPADALPFSADTFRNHPKSI